MFVYSHHVLGAAAMLLLLAAPSGCAQHSDSSSLSGGDMQQQVPYYYLGLSVLNARTLTTVNGVGVHEGDGRNSLSFNSPTNDLLVSDSNRVKVKVMPTMIEGENGALRPSTPQEASASVTVKKITSGVVAPESGDVLAETSLEEAIERKRDSLEAAFAEQLAEASQAQREALLEKEEELTTVTFPVEIEVTFSSEGVPSFAELFREGPVIEDEAAVKDFAMRLRELAEERDFDGLYEAFKPKYVDYDQAYPGQAEENNREWFEDMLKEHIYANGPLMDFEREDLKMRKWADGRVWEVNVDRGEALGDEFFLTGVGEKGRAFMDIFVARVDGELKVVR